MLSSENWLMASYLRGPSISEDLLSQGALYSCIYHLSIDSRWLWTPKVTFGQQKLFSPQWSKRITATSSPSPLEQVFSFYSILFFVARKRWVFCMVWRSTNVWTKIFSLTRTKFFMRTMFFGSAWKRDRLINVVYIKLCNPYSTQYLCFSPSRFFLNEKKPQWK